MTVPELAAVTATRFRLWAELLLPRRATPIITIGLVDQAKEFVLVTVEELTDSDVRVILEFCLRQLPTEGRSSDAG